MYDSSENYLSNFSDVLKTFGGPAGGVSYSHRNSMVFIGYKGLAAGSGVYS